MANRKISELSAQEILLLPLNLVGAAVDLVFCIPVAGRALKWVWNSILTLLQFLAGLIEIILWRAGFRPIKKMRIGFLVLSQENGERLAQPADLPPAIDYIQQVFQPARIEVLPAFPPPKRLSESGEDNEALQWMRELSPSDSARMRRVGCNLRALLQDLGLPGSSYQIQTLRNSFHATVRRISGYGAPLMVFVVEDLSGFGGCSLGWLSDYVTVKTGSLKTSAHELGHACNLLHHRDEHNLMHPSSVRFSTVTLNPWQIALLRASRHVTLI
jgi:hypothetical protein